MLGSEVGALFPMLCCGESLLRWLQRGCLSGPGPTEHHQAPLGTIGTYVYKGATEFDIRIDVPLVSQLRRCLTSLATYRPDQ